MTAAEQFAEIVEQHRRAELAAAPPLTEGQKADIAAAYLTESTRKAS